MAESLGAPQRESQVSQELINLERQVDRAGKNVERMGGRLANTLRAPTPPGEKALEKDAGSLVPKTAEVLVPLAARIAVLWKDLAAVNDQVADMLDRAEN